MCTCARVRAWKRGRDVLETREAIEHLFRQTGELIDVQVDGPAEDTHETARAHKYTHGSRNACQQGGVRVCHKPRGEVTPTAFVRVRE